MIPEANTHAPSARKNRRTISRRHWTVRAGHAFGPSWWSLLGIISLPRAVKRALLLRFRII